MKLSLHRLFCLLLCAVMVVGMIPATASAAQDTARQPIQYEEQIVEEPMDAYMVNHGDGGVISYTPTTVTRERKVHVPVRENTGNLSFSSKDSITDNGWGDYTFETFEDLKELCAKTYDDFVSFTYAGNSTLIISENLTIPGNTTLNFYGDKYSMVISKGKTLTMAGDSWLYVDNLKVNGTLISNNTIHVSKNLTVAGNLTAWIVEVELDTVITGAENITCAGEDYVARIYGEAKTFTEVKSLISLAKSNPNYYYLVDYRPGKDLSISSSVTIPSNFFLDLYCYNGDDYTFTLGSGATLKIDGRFTCRLNMTVKGKLVNNRSMDFCGRSLKITSTGSYSGSGYLLVDPQIPGLENYTDVVTGLNADNLDVVSFVDEWEDEGEIICCMRWEIRDISSLTRLSAPTNLTWNKAMVWDQDTMQYKETTRYGSFRFTPGKVTDGLDYTTFYLQLFKDGKFVYEDLYYYSSDELANTTYGYGSLFTNYEFESGTYYFTLMARANHPDYHNSTVVKSPSWTYRKPSETMAKPSGLSVTGLVANWTPYTDNHTAHAVEVYYAPSADAERELIHIESYEHLTSFYLNGWMLQDYGYGYYSFRVRTLSTNITKKNHSGWTSFKTFHYTKDSKPATPTLYIYNYDPSGKPCLEWPASPYALKYQIYRATSKTGEYSHLKTLTFAEDPYYVNYMDSSAATGKTYYYKVRAISVDGVKSSFSSAKSGKALLANPETISISNDASTGKPVVKWSAVTGAAKYDVYRATSKNGEFKKIKTTTSRSFTDTDTTAGKVYYYGVIAVHEKSSYNSIGTEIVYTRCDLKRPVVTISHSTAGNPYLKWSEISGAEKYFIYRATSKTGSYTRIGSTTSLKYVDKDVTEGKTYYYKVKAIHSNSNANSAYSAIDYITAK